MSSREGSWLDYRTHRPPTFDRDTYRAFPDDAILTVTEAEKAALLRAALSCPADPYDPSDREAFIRAARSTGTDVITSATRRTALRVLDEGFGGLLVTNLPCDPELPPTPAAGGPLAPGTKSTFVHEFTSVALGTLVDAEIFNFRQEGRGTAPLFDNVVPVPSLREQRGAGGYANNFPFHCESSFHRKKPDYVVLTGVRSGAGAVTLVGSLVDVPAGLVASQPTGAFRLMPPQLYTEMADEGVPLGTPHYSYADPVGAGGMNINFNGTECDGVEALEWLALLEDHVEATAVGCMLAPGNAVILNNHRTCHTRTGYDPVFGAEARWFVRSNFKRNLWAAAEGDVPHALTQVGWVDESGVLTEEFRPFAENPAALRTLSASLRGLAEEALSRTPTPGSRIV